MPTATSNGDQEAVLGWLRAVPLWALAGVYVAACGMAALMVGRVLRHSLQRVAKDRPDGLTDVLARTLPRPAALALLLILLALGLRFAPLTSANENDAHHVLTFGVAILGVLALMRLSFRAIDAFGRSHLRPAVVGGHRQGPRMDRGPGDDRGHRERRARRVPRAGADGPGRRVAHARARAAGQHALLRTSSRASTSSSTSLRAPRRLHPRRPLVRGLRRRPSVGARRTCARSRTTSSSSRTRRSPRRSSRTTRCRRPTSPACHPRRRRVRRRSGQGGRRAGRRGRSDQLDVPGMADEPAPRPWRWRRASSTAPSAFTTSPSTCVRSGDQAFRCLHALRKRR